jgi:hypothetical protein
LYGVDSRYSQSGINAKRFPETDFAASARIV